MVGRVAGAEACKFERGSRNVPYLLAFGAITEGLPAESVFPASEGRRKVESLASVASLSWVSTDAYTTRGEDKDASNGINSKTLNAGNAK